MSEDASSTRESAGAQRGGSAVRSRPFDEATSRGKQPSAKEAMAAALLLAQKLADQQSFVVEQLSLAEKSVAHVEDWAKHEEIPRLEEQLELAEAEIASRQRTVDDLRRELGDLRDEHELLVERFRDVERQYLELSQAYITSSHLHASLDPDEVLANLSAILVNLVGAQAFVVYLVDERTGELNLVAQEGCEDEPGWLELDAVSAKNAFSSRSCQSLPANQTLPLRPSRALAVIPLVIADQPQGIIVIHRVFEQKKSFSSADLELFQLLGAHAATALYAAHAYHASERKRVTLEGFVNAIRSQFQEPPSGSDGAGHE